MRTPQLSIAVPVYNGEKFLGKCLESIAQSVQSLNEDERASVEVIVCDNCSSDRSLEIAREARFDCVSRVVQTPEFYDNRTLNWRHALSQATGTWMMMLHADDLLAPQGFPALVSACKRKANDPRVIMISGRVQYFSDTTPPGRAHPLWPLPSRLSGKGLRHNVLPLLCPFVPFTVMRRASYEQVGGLDAQYELVQDWDLWFRLLGLGDMYIFPQVFGLWRTHGFSEKYARIFAFEHAKLALRIRELVPDLDEQATLRCLRVQLAKARNWVSDLTAETLAAEIDGISAEQKEALASHFPTPEEIQPRLRQADQAVSASLYWLRFSGGFKLLAGSPSSSTS
ncbi:MAG: glycosyltransferase [Gemmataceae bacterium]